MTDSASGLLLNPRLAREVQADLEAAWAKFSRGRPELFRGEVYGFATSGSTSERPSLILLSREALEVSAAAVNRHLHVSKDDVWGLALPRFHVGGFGIDVRAKLSGSRVREWNDSWEPKRFHAWLSGNSAKESVTLLSLVPTQVFDLVQSNLRAPVGLRALVVGGGRLDVDLHHRARELGWPVLASYGLTECSSQVATAACESDGFDLVPLDHADIEVTPQGRIAIRSKALALARIVFRRHKENANSELESTLEDVATDGWFTTADRGELEIGANSLRILKVSGRDGDVVKVLGELVDVVKVRQVLERAAQGSLLTTQTYLAAVPDPRRGFLLTLFFEGSELADQIQLLVDRANRQLAPFERVERVCKVDRFPRSDLGKILQAELIASASRLGS